MSQYVIAKSVVVGESVGVTDVAVVDGAVFDVMVEADEPPLSSGVTRSTASDMTGLTSCSKSLMPGRPP